MASNVYVNGGLQLYTTAMGALVSLPTQEFSQPSSSEHSTDETGSIFNTFTATRSREDKVTGSTKNVADLLNAIPGPYWSRCITADPTHVGLALIGEKLSQCDARASGANHTRFRYKEGHLKLNSLQADNQQDATLTYEYVMTSSDGSDNLEVAHNQSLPTLSATKVYTLGRCKAGDVLLAGLTRFALDFEVSVLVRADAGAIEPSLAATIQVVPRARLTFADWSKVGASIPKGGLLCSHSDTLFQLIQREHGEEHMDYTDSVHIGITMAGKMSITNRGSASGTNEGATEVEIMGTKESATAPLTINTAAQYNAALA